MDQYYLKREMQLNEPTESYFLILSIMCQHVIRNFNVVASHGQNFSKNDKQNLERKVSRVRMCALP